MEEEKQTEEEAKPMTMIDDANLAAKRLEDANKVHAELLARQEKLMAESRLGGKTEGGETVEKKEESNTDYAKRILQNQA